MAKIVGLVVCLLLSTSEISALCQGVLFQPHWKQFEEMYPITIHYETALLVLNIS